MNLTLKEYIDWIRAKKFSAQEIAQSYLQKAKEHDTFRAFLSVVDDVPTNIWEGALAWAPIAIKDNILVKWMAATCGSKILQEFVAPYTATCVTNLESNGGFVIWKTNMDEFAMGSSTESSAFSPTTNPHGVNRVPWGSSGGSAAAVAWDFCLAALWTDTGGSVRQPAALCGVVGLKPTYGRVSRYGVQAMGSSLDQVSTFTKSVEDAALLLGAVDGYDPHDATSVQRNDHQTWIQSLQKNNVKGMKIALVKEFFAAWLDSRIRERLEVTLDQLQGLGAIVQEVSIPLITECVSAYYTIMPAEVSTNLARFDWMRFGLQKNIPDFPNLASYYATVRSQGFGEEVRRRIMTGTYVLSSEHYETYFLAAEAYKLALQKQFEGLFATHDLIVSPTSPMPARKIGSITDPVALYLADIYTIPANLTGIPAISLPAGTVDDQGEQLPIGIQFMANHWREDLLFCVGSALELN